MESSNDGGSPKDDNSSVGDSDSDWTADAVSKKHVRKKVKSRKEVALDTQSPTFNIANIPVEVLLMVFSNCTYHTLFRLTRVCKYFRQLLVPAAMLSTSSSRRQKPSALPATASAVWATARESEYPGLRMRCDGSLPLGFSEYRVFRLMGHKPGITITGLEEWMEMNHRCWYCYRANGRIYWVLGIRSCRKCAVARSFSYTALKAEINKSLGLDLTRKQRVALLQAIPCDKGSDSQSLYHKSKVYEIFEVVSARLLEVGSEGEMDVFLRGLVERWEQKEEMEAYSYAYWMYTVQTQRRAELGKWAERKKKGYQAMIVERCAKLEPPIGEGMLVRIHEYRNVDWSIPFEILWEEYDRALKKDPLKIHIQRQARLLEASDRKKRVNRAFHAIMHEVLAGMYAELKMPANKLGPLSKWQPEAFAGWMCRAMRECIWRCGTLLKREGVPLRSENLESFIAHVDSHLAGDVILHAGYAVYYAGLYHYPSRRARYWCGRCLGRGEEHLEGMGLETLAKHILEEHGDEWKSDSIYATDVLPDA
ncbi:hypothetical protein YB2330_003202 [Saitoella coloradoensis]